LAILFVLAACSQQVQEIVPTAQSSVPPIDAVDPTSLQEGNTDIFGLRLPARASVNRQTPISASANIPWPFERVANYFRERLVAESIDVGPRATIFRNAQIRGGNSEERFNVVIRRTGYTAEVSFRKETGGVSSANPGDDVAAPRDQMDGEQLEAPEVAPPLPSSR